MGANIVIGTRGSRLALWQANWVKSELEARFADVTVGLEIIKTKGDKILDVPLAKVGGKGLFVKEIEEALLDGRIDLAVHSLKDMPAQIPNGLCIGAFPEREIPNDALVSNGKNLSDLNPGARIGTSSLRRAAQILHARPDLEIVSLRGNLDTRLRKLDEGEMDAIILAASGLKRMGFDDRISQLIDETVMLPAVGQGALCIEIREQDDKIGPLIAALDHPQTRTVVLGERSFLAHLEGGCQVPIAAHGTIDGDQIHLTGLVAALDGGTIIKAEISGSTTRSEELGVRLAEQLLDQGAGIILEELKESHP
jgi:hydroxymethylbilane synthase